MNQWDFLNFTISSVINNIYTEMYSLIFKVRVWIFSADDEVQQDDVKEVDKLETVKEENNESDSSDAEENEMKFPDTHLKIEHSTDTTYDIIYIKHIITII